MGDETREAPAGSFAWLPRGEPGAEATVLMITVPAMLEGLLARFRAAASWPEREAVAAGFGITFLPG